MLNISGGDLVLIIDRVLEISNSSSSHSVETESGLAFANALSELLHTLSLVTKTKNTSEQ